MKYVFFMGPPRCGLRYITSHLCDYTGVWSRKLNKVAELAELFCKENNIEWSPGIPLPWVQSWTVDVPSFMAALESNARQEGWNGKDHLAINIRNVLPLAMAINVAVPNCVWVCVSRPAVDVERACAATKWHPPMPTGSWSTYAIHFESMVRSIQKAMPTNSFQIDSNAFFKGDTSRLKYVADFLGCQQKRGVA